MLGMLGTTWLMTACVERRVIVPYLYLLIVVLVIAAVISLVLSFFGILLVGALKLLPLVFVVLVLAIVVGRLKITVFRNDNSDRDDRWLQG